MDFIRYTLGLALVLFMYIVIARILMSLARYIGEHLKLAAFIESLLQKIKTK